MFLIVVKVWFNMDFLIFYLIFAFLLGGVIVWVIFLQKIKSLEEKIKLINENFDETIEFEKNMGKIQQENLKEKIELLENSKKELKQEFENLANKLFEENSKKSSQNINLFHNICILLYLLFSYSK